MKTLARLFPGLLAPALILALLAAGPAAAQGNGKAITTVLIDNERVNVVEVRYRPGDEASDDRSSYRINRTIQGGTLQRIYPDGKTETVELKTGATRYLEPSKGGNYMTKNIGKTDLVSLVIRLK